MKYIVLVCDAPPHGISFHNGKLVDDHPNGGPTAQTEVIQHLVNSKIDLVLISAIPTYTSIMENRFSQQIQELGGVFAYSPLCDNFVPPQFHLIFVLDDSGSMSGTPWRDLENAFSSLS